MNAVKNEVEFFKEEDLVTWRDFQHDSEVTLSNLRKEHGDGPFRVVWTFGVQASDIVIEGKIQEITLEKDGSLLKDTTGVILWDSRWFKKAV